MRNILKSQLLNTKLLPLNKGNMKHEFSYNFKSCYEHGQACGWTVLCNSDIPSEHRSWEPGKYIVTAPGG